MPWLLWLIYTVVEPKFRVSTITKQAGGVLNTKQIAVVRAAIKAAAGVPDSSIAVTDEELGHCLVQSSSQQGTSYDVRDVRSAEPRCDCPQGLRGQLCKHAVACMLRLKYTESEVMMLHGSLRGSSAADGKLGLGVGVVHDATLTQVGTVTALSTQCPAAEEQAERAVDYRAGVAAVLTQAQAVLDSSSASDAWLKCWEAELTRALARGLSLRRECGSEATAEMVHLREKGCTRPDKGMKRQHTLLGSICSGGKQSRPRVMADRPTEERPADLVAFRDAPRQKVAKASTMKEKLDTLGPDDAVEEVYVETAFTCTAVSCSQSAAEAARLAQVQSYVALLMAE